MRVVDGVEPRRSRNGEFVSIIGPSGCGKTTLMNIVGGFVQPTARRGAARRPSRSTAPGPDRGVIFQEYGVFPWLTVRGNIEFGLRLRAEPRRRRASATRSSSATCALMGLTDFADHFPSTSPAACASASRSPAPTRSSPSSC